MKNTFKTLFLVLTIVFAVFAQEDTLVNEEIISDSPPVIIHRHSPSHLHPYVGHVGHVGHIERIKGLVANARSELKANRNTRPSTEYSIHDIAFTFAKFLPSWLYPDSVWKEDPVTRRRHIAKIVRSSPLIARPRTVVIRDKVAEWTKRSGEALSNEYIKDTLVDLDSLLDSINDFITTATDVELMDSLFLTAGYITLDGAINDFIKANKDKFASTIHNVNTDFNHIAALSGELRGPIESLRHDAIAQTQQIRKEMFESGIENRLRVYGHHIRTELQNLYQEVKHAENNNQPEASKALRRYTTESLRSEIESLNDIKVTLGKSKSIIHHVWENATRELIQSPVKIDYWVDVAAELKDAIVELGRALTSTKKNYGKHHHSDSCGCAWNK